MIYSNTWKTKLKLRSSFFISKSTSVSQFCSYILGVLEWSTNVCLLYPLLVAGRSCVLCFISRFLSRFLALGFCQRAERNNAPTLSAQGFFQRAEPSDAILSTRGAKRRSNAQRAGILSTRGAKRRSNAQRARINPFGLDQAEQGLVCVRGAAQSASKRIW